MWETIESFGLSRKIIDPRQDLPQGQICKLYEVIKEHEEDKDKRDMRAGIHVPIFHEPKGHMLL